VRATEKKTGIQTPFCKSSGKRASPTNPEEKMMAEIRWQCDYSA
jgi:hypothetical protein